MKPVFERRRREGTPALPARKALRLPAFPTTAFWLLSLLSLSHVGVTIGAERSATNHSRLPVIRLDARTPIVSDPKVPCTVAFHLPSPDATPGDVLPALVCVHGGVSQVYPKKSYRFILEKPVDWLGLRKSTHWVLNAAAIDRSLMRHKLSYDLFRALSSPAAPRLAAGSRFIELELNGKYAGAYLLMERVDRALLGLRRFDSNASSQACIFKAVDHAANFAHSGHAGFEQREPDPAVQPYWGPLHEFNRFVSRAPDTEFFHPTHGISARLDLDNAIDFHLLVLLTSNLDGITKNFILARDAAVAGQPAPRFFFVPWDYDATFGRNWNGAPVEPKAWLSNHLFDRLHADAAFRQKFAARWQQLRAGVFSGPSLRRAVDDNARMLGEAAQRNAERWRSLQSIYPDELSFAEDLAQMRQWIEARTQWLDEEIQRRR